MSIWSYISLWNPLGSCRTRSRQFFIRTFPTASSPSNLVTLTQVSNMSSGRNLRSVALQEKQGGLSFISISSFLEVYDILIILSKTRLWIHNTLQADQNPVSNNESPHATLWTFLSYNGKSGSKLWGAVPFNRKNNKMRRGHWVLSVSILFIKQLFLSTNHGDN